MKKTIAVTGSTGFIGSRLRELAEAEGRTIIGITRGDSGENRIHWSLDEGTIDSDALVAADAVIHLAGESILGLRWTDEKKRKIMESRRKGTDLIARAMASLDDGPRVLVSASAIGVYGDRGDLTLDEGSSLGDDFLAEVCKVWEASADPARAAGIRVVHPRIGLVLAKHGGALEKMLPAFKLGVGGQIGSGKQYLSWVTLDDLCRALLFCADNEELSGPVNVTAPHPATNKEFVDALGDALHRPSAIPLPKFAVKAAMGEMGVQTLLASQRVSRSRLRAAGFEFRHPNLEDALSELVT